MREQFVDFRAPGVSVETRQYFAFWSMAALQFALAPYAYVF